MTDLIAEKGRNPREKAKLAANVSKVIQNLRAKSESANSAKTPTRGSQSPGLGYSSNYDDSEDERGANDTRSFNRSRRGSQHSQMSTLDVFQQGFGERDSPDPPVTRPVPRRDSTLPLPGVASPTAAAASSGPQQQLQRNSSRGQLQQQQQQQQSQQAGSRSASRLSYQELAKQAASQPSQYQLPSAFERGSPTNSARSGNSDGGRSERSTGSRGSGNRQPVRRSSSQSQSTLNRQDSSRGQQQQQQQLRHANTLGNIPAARTSSNSIQAGRDQPQLQPQVQQQQQQQDRPTSSEGSPKLRRKSSVGQKPAEAQPQQQQQQLQGSFRGAPVNSPPASYAPSSPPVQLPKSVAGAASASSYNFGANAQSFDVRDSPSQEPFRVPSRFERDSNETPAMQRGQSLLNSLGGGAGSRSASAFDPSWVDGTIQQTTFQGIEESEYVIRKRIWHAAMFRPKVWFQTNLLPQIRQEDLKNLASKKRRMFIELAEPNFRLKVMQTANFDRMEIKIQFDEGLQREELEKATLLWRTQVKGAFDRLVDQLYVEMTRKQEDLRRVVHNDTSKAANATLDKTSFSFLHLHKMFGESMLRRSKELYIYYFGIFASMNIKESRSRAHIAGEQNIERMMVELDRMRVFIAHVEKVEFENLVKYFQGEKRIIENEVRFKPKPMLRNTSVPAIKDPRPDLFSAKSATAASSSAFDTSSNLGRRSLQATPAASASSYAERQDSLSMTPASIRAPSQQQQHTSSSRMEAATPLSFQDRRKEAQSPFPLDALERQQPKRTNAAQQHAEMVERELRATPLMRPGSTVNNLASATKLPFQDSYLSGGREMYNQAAPQPAPVTNPNVGGYYQQDAIYEKKPIPPVDQVQYLTQNQVTGTAIQQSPVSAIEKRAGAQAYDKLGRALQWTEDRSSSFTKKQQPSSGSMMAEDRRRHDDEEDLLTSQAVRGGTVLPKIVESTGARKQREVSEGVISGLMLVSNIMAGGNSSQMPPTPPSPAAVPVPDYAAARLPPISNSSSSQQTPAQQVVSSIGRMLLGQTNMPSAPSFAVPSDNLEVSAVRAAETDTAVALLLMLHKNAADTIKSDEVNVRKSLVFYAQEHKKDAIVASGQNRVNKFYTTRMERVLCEEAEARGDLYALQRHEFGLHVQRQQWFEYFLLTTEESTEREGIVSMSHLSTAILSRYVKQEFSATSLMEHQALLQQQLHVYQRWFLAEVSLPTSCGLHVYQNERRERNKLIALMDKEHKMLEKEARGIAYRKEQYSIPQSSDITLEMEALTQLEDIQRRNIARVFQESRARFVFEFWDEQLNRKAIILGREKWFRDLIRPTQFRMLIHTSEQDRRRELVRELANERCRVIREGLLHTYELSYREMVVVEQREFRRLTMDHLKERRQREARAKEHVQKQESMSKYIQSAIVSESKQSLGAYHQLIAEGPRDVAAVAAAGSRQSAPTPSGPDYTTASALRSSSRRSLDTS